MTKAVTQCPNPHKDFKVRVSKIRRVWKNYANIYAISCFMPLLCNCHALSCWSLRCSLHCISEMCFNPFFLKFLVSITRCPGKFKVPRSHETSQTYYKIIKHQDKHSRHKVVIENLRRSQKISEDLRSNLANKTRTTSGHSLVKSRSWAAGASAGSATGAAQR